MTEILTRALIAQCCDIAYREERRAHAEFYYHRTAAQRRELAAPGPRPWRGYMQPSLVNMINILEEMGAYEAEPLTVEGVVAE